VVKVSKNFLDLLKKVKHFSNITSGMFNPFILPELQKAGYEKSMTSDEESIDYKGRALFNATKIETGEDWIRIPKESAIDLGGIGKGYLADSLGKLLDRNIDNYCISLGGDILVKGVDEKGPWNINIALLGDELLEAGSYELRLDKLGIATSSVLRKNKLREQLHIINPKTGEILIDPEYKMCTVVANNATTADVLASCFLMMDHDAINDFIDRGIIKGAFLQGYKKKETFGSGFEIFELG
jgi:thiamine biosynthesis lipoprotein